MSGKKLNFSIKLHQKDYIIKGEYIFTKDLISKSHQS